MIIPWAQILIAALTSSAFTTGVLVGLAFLGRSIIGRWLSRDLEKYKAGLQATLEEYKAELQATNDRELERYRYQINALFNRITKIHEREIEVLPTAWQKLQDALGYVVSFTQPYKRYPALNQWTKQQIDEFLKKEELSEFHKQQLLEAPDKEEYYIETIFPYRLHEAKKYVVEFHNYLLYNRIFLSPDLYTQFKAMDELLTGALHDSEVGKESQDYQLITRPYKEIQKKADSITEEIGRLVQKRLRLPEAE
jgi:hypothetical protein